MKNYWPELLVLVLFLLGDFVWNGFASALAGVGAGLLAFVILLFFKKKKPALIVEGLLFGGITALGEFFYYPGGNLLLMELVFGVVLITASFLGKDVFSIIAGGFGKGLFSKQQSTILSKTLGSVLLIHASLCTLLALGGYLSWWSGGVLFILIYMIALRKSRMKMKNAAQSSLPVLVEETKGLYRLEKQGTICGCLRLITEDGIIGDAEVVTLEIAPHEFICILEDAFRKRGFRGIAIDTWPYDEIELEMKGYLLLDGKWRKRF